MRQSNGGDVFGDPFVDSAATDSAATEATDARAMADTIDHVCTQDL